MYYLENGQEVNLDKILTDENGKTLYLVTPIFSGEAMRVSGGGGYHHEICVDYEHEAPQIVVNKVFEQAPTEKLEKRYAEILKNIEAMNLALGFAKKEHDNFVNQTNKLSTTQNQLELNIKSLNQTKDNLHESINKYVENRNNLIKVVEELKLTANSLKSDETTITIKKEDYASLQKRDFKLQCLENGGVDNWEWYGESLNAYNEKYEES